MGERGKRNEGGGNKEKEEGNCLSEGREQSEN